MNYISYEKVIVLQHHVRICGWPEVIGAFRAPSRITPLDNVRLLLEALESGTCHWAKMTAEEVEKYREEVNRREQAGEVVGTIRKVRSDKGGTHSYRKRVRDEGEEDEDEDEEDEDEDEDEEDEDEDEEDEEDDEKSSEVEDVRPSKRIKLASSSSKKPPTMRAAKKGNTKSARNSSRRVTSRETIGTETDGEN